MSENGSIDHRSVEGLRKTTTYDLNQAHISSENNTESGRVAKETRILRGKILYEIANPGTYDIGDLLRWFNELRLFRERAQNNAKGIKKPSLAKESWLTIVSNLSECKDQLKILRARRVKPILDNS